MFTEYVGLFFFFCQTQFPMDFFKVILSIYILYLIRLKKNYHILLDYSFNISKILNFIGSSKPQIWLITLSLVMCVRDVYLNIKLRATPRGQKTTANILLVVKGA